MLRRILAAQVNFIKKYGIQPNAVLLSLDFIANLRCGDEILDMKVIECDQFTDPICILM